MKEMKILIIAIFMLFIGALVNIFALVDKKEKEIPPETSFSATTTSETTTTSTSVPTTTKVAPKPVKTTKKVVKSMWSR